MSWETFFWGSDAEAIYRNFHRHRLSFNFVQVMRDIMSLVLFALIGIAWYFLGQYTLLFLTNWGIHLAYISLHLNSMATQDQQNHPGKVKGFLKWRWRLAVIIFQVALNLEILLTILFWGLLWKTPEEYTYGHFIAILAHSLPAGFLLIDFLLQKWVFRFNHIWFIFLTALIYGIVNFMFVKYTGVYVYPILKWNDIVSIILSFLALVMIAAIQGSLYIISLLNKRRSNKIPLYVPIQLIQTR
ncbi:unnamed protein product [Moneuplotes crassus]|uniref:Uncharacterized protein n=1 Tax=Euplotes crassus TaxID=5936 RepID=A0AAD1XVI3_EUPCR|nr:unnamed protein product [Moneuplotes crassus]